MNPHPVGPILAIAVRSAPKAAMVELTRAAVTEHGGIGGDLESEPARGITFLSARQWTDVLNELGVVLPWHTRRANVLLDTGGLEHLIGRQVQVGSVRIAIRDQTAPCGLMDQLHPGLRQALTPDCRGGVHGEVIVAGTFAIGDVVTLCE